MGNYTFEVEGRTKVLRSVRSQPPAHCRLEIKSFASILKALDDDDSIRSPEFSAAGNTWTMSIHLKGPTKDNGDHYVSLYLRKVNKGKSHKNAQVTIRFLIYDYIRGDFLIIQDDLGRLAQRKLEQAREPNILQKYLKHKSSQEYDSGNQRCGIARALLLKEFRDPKNGFVKNDRCTFGVEVFAHIPMDYPSASLVPFKDVNDTVVAKSWITRKYSELDNETLGDKFQLCGRSWKFEINPKGYEAAKGKFLSLFLRMVDTSDLVNGNKVFAEFQLILKNLDSSKHLSKTTTNWFSDNGTVSSGFTEMIPLNELMSKSKGFLMNECLNVKVVIKALYFFKIK